MAYLENTLRITDDALKIFKQLSKNVNKSIKTGEEIDTKTFATTVRFIGDSFEYQGQKYLMNSNGGNFAESLVSQNRFDLASILYGILIKSNSNNPALLEHFAQRGLAAAKKSKDPIHIMARADDLNKLYRMTEYGSKKHLKALSEEKCALLDIVKNYRKAVQNYKTITRKPLSLDHYEFMLCGIRMEIAKITMDSNPFIAINELEAAQKLIRKYGDGTLTRRIEMLLDEAYARL